MKRSSKICNIIWILRTAGILVIWSVLSGMMVPTESIETYWTPFKLSQHYLFCEPRKEETFNVYSPWYQPLDKEVVDHYYKNPSQVKFYLYDLQDCKIFYETLKYTDKDLLEMDPGREIYTFCQDFSNSLRESQDKTSGSFMASVMKLFQWEY